MNEKDFRFRHEEVKDEETKDTKIDRPLHHYPGNNSQN